MSARVSDPTKTPLVRQVLKGICTLHPKPEKQAELLQLRELEDCVAWLERVGTQARVDGDLPRLLRCWRDRALLLIGFWRAFRSDELCRLRVEHIQARAGEGMQLFLPWSKSDRNNLGQSFSAPALVRLCPVQAYLDWVEVAEVTDGPVFVDDGEHQISFATGKTLGAAFGCGLDGLIRTVSLSGEQEGNCGVQ